MSTNGIFDPITIQHPLAFVGFVMLFAFLAAKDLKHGLFQGLAVLLLIAAMANHWI